MLLAKSLSEKDPKTNDINIKLIFKELKSQVIDLSAWKRGFSWLIRFYHH